MEIAAETKTTTGYGKPPWRFTGRAVYQLHLVKSEVARALIPKDFRLVEAFGYTLGGFFFANYDHSPAGVFDELVVIAGIVWNPPTSCARQCDKRLQIIITFTSEIFSAGLNHQLKLLVECESVWFEFEALILCGFCLNSWASKVLVNSNEACFHGRREVGLPSHVARFTKRRAVDTGRRESRGNRFLNMIGFGPATDGSRFRMDTQVTEITVPTPVTEEFSINLLSPVPEENSKMWLGPPIKLSLPSFSGRTEYNPNLLKYSCQMECRVRVIRPLQIFRSSPTTDLSAEEQAVENQNSSSSNQAMEKTKDYRRRLSLSVMLSKPILALEFNCMNMNVENPLIISQ